MIDSEGYRANVGIILLNEQNHAFWARRIGEDAWQFPQGGIQEHETPEQALYRELDEEVGLSHSDVEIIGMTQDWLRYRIPEHLIRTGNSPVCIGQKQLWYLLRFVGNESRVCLDKSGCPEFDNWRWIKPHMSVKQVIAFKREVYQQALDELLPLLGSNL